MMITPKQVNGIDTRGFPERLQQLEQQRSTLILEGRLLQAQQAFAAAMDKFAQAAEMAEPFIEWAQANDKHTYAFMQRLNQLSLWAKAGNPRRALQLARTLQTEPTLTPQQKAHVDQYASTLEAQLTHWLMAHFPLSEMSPVPA